MAKKQNIFSNKEENLYNYVSDETSGERKRKIKRKKRAKKSDSNDRRYKCGFCGKTYLSCPALCTHKKLKHSLSYIHKKTVEGIETKKDKEEEEIRYNKAKVKYIEFLNDENKKSRFFDGNDEKAKIELSFKSDLISRFLNKFSNSRSIGEYPFYKFVIENWEKNLSNNEQKSFFQQIKNNYISISNNRRFKKCYIPPLDGLFFFYLKQFIKEINYNYLNNIILFIVSLRTFINESKKAQVTEDIIQDDKNEFTQLFNARDVTEIANDFFKEFLPKYSDCITDEIKNEFIKIIQHFCFWLYENDYSDSILSLIEES